MRVNAPHSLRCDDMAAPELLEKEKRSASGTTSFVAAVWSGRPRPANHLVTEGGLPSRGGDDRRPPGPEENRIARVGAGRSWRSSAPEAFAVGEVVSAATSLRSACCRRPCAGLWPFTGHLPEPGTKPRGVGQVWDGSLLDVTAAVRPRSTRPPAPRMHDLPPVGRCSQPASMEQTQPHGVILRLSPCSPTRMITAELVALGTVVTALRPVAQGIHFSPTEELKLPPSHELILPRPTDNSRPRSNLDHANPPPIFVGTSVRMDRD
jgi:hypothetical protein